MATHLQVDEHFPDAELIDHERNPVKFSDFTRPGLIDPYLGFSEGYPLIVVFYRGFFCPRDRQQIPQLVQFQSELAVNYGRLVSVCVDPPPIQAAFRAGLGAQWPFLCDEQRRLIAQIGILDETEGEYAYRAQPYTFVLRPDLSIHRIYNGWFFVGRPTIEELRHDLREIMQRRADYRYEAYTSPAVQRVRIPQQAWAEGPPPLGANGLPVVQGTVRWFDLKSGNGLIARDDGEAEVFFNFTAIPGEGYRTLSAGTIVRFELVANPYGPTARNIQKQDA